MLVADRAGGPCSARTSLLNEPAAWAIPPWRAGMLATDENLCGAPVVYAFIDQFLTS